MSGQDLPPLYTPEQVEEAWGIPASTLRAMTRERAVPRWPHSRAGKHIRFSAADIAEILRLIQVRAVTGPRPLRQRQARVAS